MRRYTLAEATALLPEVIPVLEGLRDAYLEVRAVQAAVSAQARGASGDGHLLADPCDEGGGENHIERLNQRIRQSAAQLDRWGLELKDPEKGLIDFFHERDGRMVYLCFQLGETAIAHWHDLHTGFAGRQPI
mgnify:FL=1